MGLTQTKKKSYDQCADLAGGRVFGSDIIFTSFFYSMESDGARRLKSVARMAFWHFSLTIEFKNQPELAD